MKRKIHPPFSVTLLGWGVLVIGFLNIWRAVGIYHQQIILQAGTPLISPSFQVIIMAFWSLVFLMIFFQIRERKSFSSRILWIGMSAYALFRLAWPLVAEQAGYAPIAQTVIWPLVVWAIFVFGASRPSSLHWFAPTTDISKQP